MRLVVHDGHQLLSASFSKLSSMIPSRELTFDEESVLFVFINGDLSWTPQGTAEVQLEASVRPPAASVGLPKALTGPPAASVRLPKASVGPPAASVGLPKASVGPPAASVGLPKALTGPPAASAGLPKASVGPPETMTGPPADESVEGVCPAPTTVLPRKRKECPHTVTGSQDFYPVKRVTKFKVIKGQTMKQVEWEPCKLCGKKWPLEWVADTDTIGIH
ncbi:merozoite surface protein CMZ-8-like [Osmerus eperlanus]|uniref:merozoite surface protein CMZ-8-like n=1 Tax=Osmerus eperlanus TaxID=29151 RepID=UPI002E0EF33C